MNFFDFPKFWSELQGFNALDPRQPMFQNTMDAARPTFMRDPLAGAPVQYPTANVPVPVPVADLSTSGGYDPYERLGMSPAPRQPSFLEEAGLLETPQPNPQMSMDPAQRPLDISSQPGGLLSDKPAEKPTDLEAAGKEFRRLGGMVSKPGPQPQAMAPLISPPQAGGGGRAVDITPYLRQSLIARRRAAKG